MKHNKYIVIACEAGNTSKLVYGSFVLQISQV